MQVEPLKPTSKAPGSTHLKLKCDEPLSTFAFKFNLRRYNKEKQFGAYNAWAMGRGLHSSTFQLNLSRV